MPVPDSKALFCTLFFTQNTFQSLSEHGHYRRLMGPLVHDQGFTATLLCANTVQAIICFRVVQDYCGFVQEHIFEADESLKELFRVVCGLASSIENIIIWGSQV